MRGDLLIQSTEIPPLPFDQDAKHFRTITYAQRRWRVFQRRDAQKQYWIRVAAPLDERDELMRKLLAPALLALLVPPTVSIGLRGGLKPLRKLTQSLSAATTPLTPASPISMCRANWYALPRRSTDWSHGSRSARSMSPDSLPTPLTNCAIRWPLRGWSWTWPGVAKIRPREGCTCNVRTKRWTACSAW